MLQHFYKSFKIKMFGFLHYTPEILPLPRPLISSCGVSLVQKVSDIQFIDYIYLFKVWPIF